MLDCVKDLFMSNCWNTIESAYAVEIENTSDVYHQVKCFLSENDNDSEFIHTALKGKNELTILTNKRLIIVKISNIKCLNVGLNYLLWKHLSQFEIDISNPCEHVKFRSLRLNFIGYEPKIHIQLDETVNEEKIRALLAQFQLANA